MHSFEELLQRVEEVNARFAEAAPPPFKASDRAAAGMKPLQTKLRSGATPPPPPAAAMKPKKAPETAAKSTGKPTYGTGGLGIKRGFASYTAHGGSGESKTKENVAGLSKVVAHRAKIGESLAALANECRAVLA